MPEPADWAYRASKDDRLTKVQVLRWESRHTTKYAIIRPYVGKALGEEERVPARRLKSLWHNRDAFLAMEKRWNDIRAVSAPSNRADVLAVGIVFEEVIDHSVAEFLDEYAQIRDVVTLSRFAGIAAEDVRSHPASFEEGSDLIVPWPTALTIAKSACSAFSARIIALAEAELERLRDEPTAEWPSTRAWNDRMRMAHELMRTWAGAPAFTASPDWARQLLSEVRLLRQAIERVADRLGSS